MERNNGEQGWSALRLCKSAVSLLPIVFELQSYNNIRMAFSPLWLCFISCFCSWYFYLKFLPQNTICSDHLHVPPASSFHQNMRLSLMCPYPLLRWLSSAGPPACCVCSPPSLGPHSWLRAPTLTVSYNVWNVSFYRCKHIFSFRAQSLCHPPCVSHAAFPKASFTAPNPRGLPLGLNEAQRPSRSLQLPCGLISNCRHGFLLPFPQSSTLCSNHTTKGPQRHPFLLHAIFLSDTLLFLVPFLVYLTNTITAF